MTTDVLESATTRGRLFDRRRRITVEEYHRILDAGILGREPRVELLEGVIVAKDSENPGRLFDRRRRITVEEYHQILDAGILGREPRVELLEGVIVAKMTKKTPHVQGTDLLQFFFQQVLPAGCGYFASMGNPITIEGREGEPEPDGMIVRGKIRDFNDQRRTPADAALVVEISDTSYHYDRYDKWRLYATARVPVYWIVDLNRRALEIHAEPTDDAENARYARSQIFGPDDEAALVLDGREIARFAAKELLP